MPCPWRPRLGFPQLYNFSVTRPSKVVEVVPILIGLFFVAFGLAFSTAFLFGASDRVHGSRWGGVLMSGFFALFGCGIVCAAICGNRRLKEQATAEQSHPESPWLWRKDWACSRAESKNRNGGAVLWLAAMFANTIAYTVAITTVPKLWRASDPKALFPLAFCVVGVVLAGMAARASIRRKRFGQAYLEFATLPFTPGGEMKGTIHLRFNTDAKHGIDMSLSCIRRIVTGSSKDRSVRESVFWQADKNVPQEFLFPGARGDTTIPVEFSIPADAYESNHDHPSDQVLWLLRVHADVPGVDYADEFEVPVFRRTPSLASAPETRTRFVNDPPSASAAPAFQFDRSEVAAPANPTVVFSTGLDGSIQYYFPPFRNPSRALVLLLFTTVWTGLAYFLGRSQAPFIFAGVLWLSDLLLVYALIRAMLGSCRIVAGNARIVFRRALLGIGVDREIPFSNIVQILPVTKMQQQGARASYSLRLRTTDGRNLTIADAIDSRQEARWVAAQLENLVGLKLDTHVAVEGFGVPEAPPQRSQAASGSRPALRRNNPATFLAPLVFLLVSVVLIRYQFFLPRRGKPARALQASTPGKPSRRQASYSPLSDVDVERLQTLSDQAQAEELLDRAIQHDVRALDLFEQNVGHWTNLQRTAHMNELEVRSRFSTDLRVRYANADINLAMNGWPKTENTVDRLIRRAEVDPGHRALCAYGMGLLAGRGVGYDRMYPLLVDYAKNDRDPQVRQWAVEGMRYLGTDEALDQLFSSFTHDPSDAVRDRAGCNLSDCGNFKRTQRMRMVPGLIQLTADPQTSPGMRNWAFLALGEITDESLPAQASAWQDWYRLHGADKMAEFTRLEWWRVRGDQ